MRKLNELQQRIESVRLELNRAYLQKEEFDYCYQKSLALDKLIEEYLDAADKEKQKK